jgi:hypothetical protein
MKNDHTFFEVLDFKEVFKHKNLGEQLSDQVGVERILSCIESSSFALSIVPENFRQVQKTLKTISCLLRILGTFQSLPMSTMANRL